MEQWISKDDRVPTEADADAQGCVLVWHLYNGVMITGWHRLPESLFFTHWMPPPAPPENAAELRRERDNDLIARYGCGTEPKR